MSRVVNVNIVGGVGRPLFPHFLSVNFFFRHGCRHLVRHFLSVYFFRESIFFRCHLFCHVQGLCGVLSMSATPSTTGDVDSPTVLVEFLRNQVAVSAANTRSAIPSTLMRRAADGYWVEVHILLEPEVAGCDTQELLQEIRQPRGSTSAPTPPILLSATSLLPSRHSLLPSTHSGLQPGDQFHTEASLSAEDLCGIQKRKPSMRFALPFLSLIVIAHCQQRLFCTLLLRKSPSWCAYRAAQQPPSQLQNI